MSRGPEEKRAVALPVGYAPMLLVSFLCGMAITFKNGRYSGGALLLVLVALGVLVFSLRRDCRHARLARARSADPDPRLAGAAWP